MYNASMLTDWRPPTVIDIGTGDSAYVHFSLADARVLIFDVSGCTFIASRPNADGSLDVVKDGQEVKLEQIRREDYG